MICACYFTVRQILFEILVNLLIVVFDRGLSAQTGRQPGLSFSAEGTCRAHRASHFAFGALVLIAMSGASMSPTMATMRSGLVRAVQDYMQLQTLLLMV